ncbi:polypyrimidine tract-binding protein, partial [Trifolium pratense]
MLVLAICVSHTQRTETSISNSNPIAAGRNGGARKLSYIIPLVVFTLHWDYTNPMLPVNQTAIDIALQPVGPDGKRKEPESNVLLALVENMQYAVTVDVLHTVFSAFGTVQKIAIFEKNGQTQALIQYP